MTQQEFFAHTQLYPSQVNIWYSDQGAPYTIYAITIPVKDITSPIQEDNTAQLEALQQISIPLSTGNILTLNVVTRSRVQVPSITIPGTIDDPAVFIPAKDYYYYTIVPVTISDFGNTAISVDQLVFSPSLDVTEYDGSVYNAQKGNILLNRQSDYRMAADRSKVGTLANPTYTGPININQLISGSATKARVQDSNYSNTGWVNARYEGSETSRVTYGTEPAISGKLFKGSEFPATLAPNQINYLITTQQVVYSDFFFAGIGDTPGYNPILSIYNIIAEQPFGNDGNRSILTFQVIAGSNFTKPPQEGELYRVDGSEELIKVEAVGTIPASPDLFTVYVLRGWNGVVDTIVTPIGLEVLSLVQVYNVENNKLAGVPKGQVYVKETGAALLLDNAGYVVSSSQVSN